MKERYECTRERDKGSVSNPIRQIQCLWWRLPSWISVAVSTTPFKCVFVWRRAALTSHASQEPENQNLLWRNSLIICSLGKWGPCVTSMMNGLCQQNVLYRKYNLWTVFIQWGTIEIFGIRRLHFPHLGDLGKCGSAHHVVVQLGGPQSYKNEMQAKCSYSWVDHMGLWAKDKFFLLFCLLALN